MRTRKKPSSKARKSKALLAALVISSFFYATPAHGYPLISGETDVTFGEAGTAGQTHTVHAGQTWRTYTGASQVSVTNANATVYYKDITILGGGIWQPMDAAGTINLNGTLELYGGGILDLSYKYGVNWTDNLANNPADNPWDGTGNNATVRLFRTSSTLKNAVIFHDGAILRMNLGGRAGYTTESGGSSILNDSLYLYNVQLAADVPTTVKVQTRFAKYFYGKDWLASQGNYYNNYNSDGTPKNNLGIIRIFNITDEVNDKLIFEAENYLTDSTLYKYLIIPEINSNLSGTTKMYYVNFEAFRSEMVSQGVLSAANAQLSMRNLWRMEDGLFWKRGEELRAANRLGQSEGTDGAWVQIWRGKYSFDGAYGSSFGQNYNGIQVGYDKQREGELFGGKLYTGLFLSMLNSDADFHQHSVQTDTMEALYSRSAGDLNSKGIGLYTTWQGDKGHYLDATFRWSKLNNNYSFIDSDGEIFDNSHGTWTYGAGFRYGYQQELANGWFLEPQVGLTYGTMKGYSYILDNGMRFNQEELNMLTGRLGVTAGRNFNSGDKQGIIYAKAAVNHGFKDGGRATADAGTWNSAGNYYTTLAGMPVDTLAGKDTWYEFAVGTNLQTSQDQSAFLELNKTAGGKVNTDWQVNAGVSWRFNGPSAKERKAGIDDKMTVLAAGPIDPARSESKIGTSGADVKAVIPDETIGAVDNGKTSFAIAQAAGIPAIGQASQEQTSQIPVIAIANEQAIPAFTTNSRVNQADQVTVDSSEPGSYMLDPLVVEAKRPDWEKKLSPGTVSVIHVPEYKGEMKNLPDLLQSVPGVYVQRLQGTGHYTVARVRGSTGGQVNIYIDGVLVNSNADAAVDLSIIPIENVERIEVYRGYVPARFAGSPIGGAINIVTKKPQDTRGSLTQGMRSLGGYTSNLELTAPVGSGSMLVALNRDQAKGDFRYTNLWNNSTPYEPATQDRHRQYNDYQNTDALLKWQDNNWFAKLTWQKNKTSFPESTYVDGADVPDEEMESMPHAENWFKYRKRQLVTTKSEFQFGRRETVGNLEWGWKLGTSYQLKEAATSQMKNPDGSAFLTIDNEFRSRRYEGSIDGSWQASKSHLVEFLFNTSHEAMDVRTFNPDMWPPKVITTGNLMDKYSKMFKPHYENKTYHFQMQDTMTLNRSGNLFFTPVLRAQRVDMDVAANDPDMNNWKYSYGLGLKKVQNEHWTFRSTYGTYYKFPNWYELFGDGANVKSRWEKYSNLPGQPQYLLDNYVEHGTSWDLSANWQGKALEADTDVTLTYFNRRAKNLSSYSLDFYGWGYYTNLAAGNIQGVELESKMNWGRWDLLLAATWNDSVITASGSKATLVTGPTWMAGKPFPWIPEWEYNARLGYRFPDDKLSAFAEYHYLDQVANWGAGESGSVTYDALGITNVGLKYDISSRIKLTAGVNDLFNKGPDQVYRFWSGSYSSVNNVQYPQQGRTYYMTAQYFF